MHRLIKLGRCDSYIIEWLNNRTYRLLVLIGIQAQSAKIHLAPFGTTWLRLAPLGSTWHHLAPLGTTWHHWVHLGPSGSTCVHLRPLGSTHHDKDGKSENITDPLTA